MCNWPQPRHRLMSLCSLTQSSVACFKIMRTNTKNLCELARGLDYCSFRFVMIYPLLTCPNCASSSWKIFFVWNLFVLILSTILTCFFFFFYILRLWKTKKWRRHFCFLWETDHMIRALKCSQTDSRRCDLHWCITKWHTTLPSIENSLIPWYFKLFDKVYLNWESPFMIAH